MKKIISIVLFLLLLNISFAQRILSGNYVINPSFEDYIYCPNNMCQIFLASPWSDCMNGTGSSEYFNLCTTDPGLLSTLYFQQPRTGLGMAGIYMYGLWIQDNYREYIIGKFSDSLTKHKRYCGDLFTSFLNCKGAVENIGIYFSSNPILIDSNLYALQPQIENHKGIIKDTINWVKVNGSFVANGGERYITIGNFKDNLPTNYEELNYSAMGAYYFIDDVSVCECSFDINLGADTTLCEGENIILNPMLPNAAQCHLYLAGQQPCHNLRS